jgi:dsRNA-specific ribonuclease
MKSVYIGNIKKFAKSNEIYDGKHDTVDFKNFLVDIFKKTSLNITFIDKIFENESYIKFLKMAFTSESADSDVNYEVFEQLGDVTINKFIVWYSYKRFPKLLCKNGVQVVAKIKIKYISKDVFCKISQKLGFWKYIKASVQERSRNKKALLEDTLESIVGCIEYIINDMTKDGLGNIYVYKLLKNIFDDIDIDIDYYNLSDSITLLKELFQCHKNIGYLKNKHEILETKNGNELEKLVKFSIYRIHKNREELLGYGISSNKKDAEKKASKECLRVLSLRGIKKEPPKTFYDLDNKKSGFIN